MQSKDESRQEASEYKKHSHGKVERGEREQEKKYIYIHINVNCHFLSIFDT